MVWIFKAEALCCTSRYAWILRAYSQTNLTQKKKCWKIAVCKRKSQWLPFIAHNLLSDVVHYKNG